MHVSVPLRGNGRESWFPRFIGDRALYLVSVPLRGNGRESWLISTTVSAAQVSVPLRGNGRERGLSDNTSYFLQQFQSPCGEMVVKEVLASSLRIQCIQQFQSPCGEMVVKDLGDDLGSQLTNLVSVPLRGNGRESRGGDVFVVSKGFDVSVPLRGNGRERT